MYRSKFIGCRVVDAPRELRVAAPRETLACPVGEAVIDFIDRCVRGTAAVASWIALPTILTAAVLQVLNRRLFLGNFSTMIEIATAGLFVLAMSWFGAAYLRDGHVRVDLFRRRWSDRTRAGIEIVGSLLILLPLSAVLVFYGWDGLMRTTRFADSLTWIVRIAAVVGPLLLGLSGIVVIWRCAGVFRGSLDTHAPFSRRDPE